VSVFVRVLTPAGVMIDVRCEIFSTCMHLQLAHATCDV